jgi:hypothetical protein
MEWMIVTLTLLALAAVAVLIGTQGRPLRLVSAFRETLQTLRMNLAPLAWIAASVVLVLGFLFYFYASPAMSIGPEQPIAFSHQLHAGVKAIACQYCHPYTARSNHPGLPPVEKCLHCHNYIIANHPEILKEHEYYNTGTPTPWVKVFYVPEHVLFNHQRHIRKQVECDACHGEVAQMDRLKGQRFKMGFCVQCHREKNANLDCWLACHS